VGQIRDAARAGFASGKLMSIAFRKTQLLAVAYMIKDNMKRIEEALFIDTGRPVFESDL